MNVAEKAHFDSEYDRIFGQKKLNNMEGGDVDEGGDTPEAKPKDTKDVVPFTLDVILDDN